MSDPITTLLLVAGPVVSLVLAWLGVRWARGRREGHEDGFEAPTVDVHPKPKPDTTTEELDDAATAEAADNTPPPPDPADWPDDDPAAVDELSGWAND